MYHTSWYSQPSIGLDHLNLVSQIFVCPPSPSFGVTVCMCRVVLHHWCQSDVVIVSPWQPESAHGPTNRFLSITSHILQRQEPTLASTVLFAYYSIETVLHRGSHALVCAKAADILLATQTLAALTASAPSYSPLIGFSVDGGFCSQNSQPIPSPRLRNHGPPDTALRAR